MLIASAVAAIKGNLSDKAAVQKALEKADFKSVRGNFKFGNNHVPIQNFYLQDVVKDARRIRAQDRRHHRQGQPGPLPRQMPDEVIRRGIADGGGAPALPPFACRGSRRLTSDA